MEGEASQPGADPDGDGLPNRLEFAFATDPHAPADAALAQLRLHLVDGGGQAHTALTYRRRRYAEAFSFVLETSADLARWEPLRGGAVTRQVDAATGAETVTVRAPAPARGGGGGPATFFRLRVVDLRE